MIQVHLSGNNVPNQANGYEEHCERVRIIPAHARGLVYGKGAGERFIDPQQWKLRREGRNEHHAATLHAGPFFIKELEILVKDKNAHTYDRKIGAPRESHGDQIAVQHGERGDNACQ